MAAARSRYPQRRIWAIVQPHTFSRTRALLHPLAASFSDANQVIITDIYAAREVDEGTVHAEQVVDASDHAAIQHIGQLDEVVRYLATNCVAGDVVLVMGAGDSNKIGPALLQMLQTQEVSR